MVMGILKSRSVFVNQIAASLREPLKLKDVAKRLSAQYLKEVYADKVLEGHLESVTPGVSKDDFIVMGGTDIGKKHAKYMEGLVSILLMPMRTKWKVDNAVPDPFPGQLGLKFNKKTGDG